MTSLPVGIFDSGIGGLTVTHAILNKLPNESLIYIGDTARVPYGIRDSETIKKFALELEEYLLKQNIKAIVVACNTISATCLTEVKNKALGIPVVDVISETVLEAVQKTVKNKIGVIGTDATINSKAYEKSIKKVNNNIEVISKSAPLFVPIVEEGFSKSLATRIIAEEYLKDFKENGIDTLILGCTHYPILAEAISEVLPDIEIIDSAIPTANALKKILGEEGLENGNKNALYKFYVTDSPERSQKVADIFYEGKFPGTFEKISLEEEKE